MTGKRGVSIRRSVGGVAEPLGRVRLPWLPGPRSPSREDANTANNARMVLFMTSDYLPATGGIATQTRLQARQLVLDGWRVDVLTRRRSTQSAAREVVEGIRVQRVGIPGFLTGKTRELVATWWVMVRHHRSVDVVQCIMDPDYAVVARLAGLGRRTCLMWATEGDAEVRLKGRFGLLRRAALRGCPQVVLTQAMHRELSDIGIEPTAVIPVPVDANYFEPASGKQRDALRHQLGISAELVIVFTGHLVERKGVDRLLEAFCLLIEGGEDAHLLLVGSGVGRAESLEQQLRATVAQRLAPGRVSFVGGVSDVLGYLQVADIFCLPSVREGMPNSLLEAMACGLACVAPVSAGSAELLADGAGVIPASNAPADLYDAFTSLARSAPRRSELGAAARDRVLARHSVATVVQAYQATWSDEFAKDPHRATTRWSR